MGKGKIKSLVMRNFKRNHVEKYFTKNSIIAKKSKKFSKEFSSKFPLFKIKFSEKSRLIKYNFETLFPEQKLKLNMENPIFIFVEKFFFW
jgi:hypothetical protein